MRIIYLHQYYRTPEESGGTRSYEMARRFAAAGHEVHVVATRAPDGDTGWRTKYIGDVAVHSLPVAYDNTMSFGRRIAAFLYFAIFAGRRAARLQPDVIIATSTPLTIAIPAAVAKWSTRAPIVFEVRDLWPELPIAMGVLRNPVTRHLAGALETFAYRISAEFVALSPGMKDGIVAKGIAPSRVTVIPNSCDNELFSVPASAGEDFRMNQGIVAGAPLVVYCGTLGHINAVGYLARLAAECLARSSPIIFLVVGAGAEQAAIQAEAARLGVLDENFHMMDVVPKLQIPAVLSAATVSCSLFLPLPEMEANSANKFFDTLAAGRPVLLNYGGWQAEIVRRAGAGVVLPWSDMSEAADTLLEFVSRPEAVASAGLAARRLAHEDFDRGDLAARFLEIVERVAAQR